MELITGPELLTYAAGATAAAAAPDAVTWADDVAAATNAAVSRALDYPTESEPDPVTWAGTPDMHAAALAAGAERWKRREAPFGIAGYDVSGSAIRLSADDLRPARQAIARWGYQAGIGLA